MSKLYYSEDGHVVPTLCEEVTTYRRARKVLHLPRTSAPGTLYLLARSYKESPLPLRVSVNGTEISPIPPGNPIAYFWYRVPVEAARLREGANTFEFWTDAPAMNAWSLAMEGGYANPESAISDDEGRTWRNERMGYLNVQRGEYVARLRLAEGEDPPPAAMVWEDASNPRLARLRKIMPPVTVDEGPLMRRVRALSSWLSASWEHTATGRAAQYAPWDVETILAWGKARSGHDGQLAITMCVHYGAAFVSCCQAVGIPARCAVLMGTPNGYDGHFVTEVWFEEYGKWVMVDPNSDAILFKDGVPLSITEIQRAGDDLSGLIEWGPGAEFQRTFPHMVKFAKENLEKGLCFRHRSIWHRADFQSHPELTPPGHGSTSYCETGLVWEKRDLKDFGMFPYFGDPAYFDAPPRVS
ncbi:MAG: transglutaminase domain-containing protein [Candidatus Latescibacteria bacterium]|nr:transglutaminase domain-containing protein [Candidatus Latescibacterota bacterium]